MDLRLKL